MVNAKLQLALRRNKGLRIRDRWLRELSEICGLSLGVDDLLGLEETEIARADFYQVIRSLSESYQLEWRDAVRPEMWSFLLHGSQAFGSEIAILFSDVDEFIGAVRVPVRAVLANAEAVFDHVVYDLALAGVDMTNGLILERNYFGLDKISDTRGVFTLLSWGSFSTKLGLKNPL